MNCVTSLFAGNEMSYVGIQVISKAMVESANCTLTDLDVSGEMISVCRMVPYVFVFSFMNSLQRVIVIVAIQCLV